MSAITRNAVVVHAKRSCGCVLAGLPCARRAYEGDAMHSGDWLSVCARGGIGATEVSAPDRHSTASQLSVRKAPATPERTASITLPDYLHVSTSPQRDVSVSSRRTEHSCSFTHRRRRRYPRRRPPGPREGHARTQSRQWHPRGGTDAQRNDPAARAACSRRRQPAAAPR